MPTPDTKPKTRLFYKRAVEIIINGQLKKVKKKWLSYKEVVELAFPNAEFGPLIVYTVNYKKGPRRNPKGVMVEGDIVKVKKGMLFNVTRTDKS